MREDISRKEVSRSEVVRAESFAALKRLEEAVGTQDIVGFEGTLDEVVFILATGEEVVIQVDEKAPRGTHRLKATVSESGE